MTVGTGRAQQEILPAGAGAIIRLEENKNSGFQREYSAGSRFEKTWRIKNYEQESGGTTHKS